MTEEKKPAKPFNAKKFDMESFNTASQVSYSGVSVSVLKSVGELSLITFGIDGSSSMSGYESIVMQSIINLTNYLKKCNRSENIVVRVVKFAATGDKWIQEIHGFKPIRNINPDDYKYTAGGATPITDFFYESAMSTRDYAMLLCSDEAPTKKDPKHREPNDKMCNGALYCFADGGDNHNHHSVEKFLALKKKINKDEEGLISMSYNLIGINDAECKNDLEEVMKKLDLDAYKSAGDLDSGGANDLVDFVGEHIKSTSSLLTGVNPAGDATKLKL